MPEADPAPVMEETAVANGGASADAAALDKKDAATKEVAAESKDTAVADNKPEEQNKVSENGAKDPSDGDVKMAEAETAMESDGDPGEGKQVISDDVKTDGVQGADAKEDSNPKTAEDEDTKMTEAEIGNTAGKEKGQEKDKDENMDKTDEVKDQEKGDSADQEENKGKESGAAEKQEEEAEEKGSGDKEEEEAGDNADEEKLEKDGAKNQGKDSEVTEEQVDESDKKVEESKEGTPKNKKARTARDRSQGKDKKQDGPRSREAKSLLNTSSPYGTDRPQRERKTVERLVEAIEKEPNTNFIVEKGSGTPLKDIPSVANRISRKKPADLKFLHNILFGRKGKTVDFKGHILQFSGFVWHESDDKQRAKAKEKLDKCVKDVLLDLCWLLAIPVPKTNIRKEDIVSKLLDFIAEPRGVTDSGLSDDQGSNSRKRKRRGGSASKTPDSTPDKSKKKFGDDTTSGKRRKKALKYDSDEDEDDDESMRSDSEDNKDADADEAADEHEDDYGSVKGKTSKKSSEVKESSGKKKTDPRSGHKAGSPRTISESPAKKSSSKISKEKESPDDSTKVFSRKRKPMPKGALISEKEIKEKKSSGTKITKGSGKRKTAEASLPSKDELRKTIIGILKKVDFNTATFSDILKKLDNHYKMDLTPKKEVIKIMIQDELNKLSEVADEEEDGTEDAEKKRQQAKEVEA